MTPPESSAAVALWISDVLFQNKATLIVDFVRRSHAKQSRSAQSVPAFTPSPHAPQRLQGQRSARTHAVEQRSITLGASS